MIQVKSEAQLALMRAAGLVVYRTLQVLREAVAPGVTTAALDALAESEIRAAGAVPSFKGYRPHPSVPAFPASICASVNDEVVHGVPGPRTLVEGDIISIDCGAILAGWHGDAAVTIGVGSVSPEAQQLIAATEDAMWSGIAAVRVGGRVSDISHAVEVAARAAGRYGIVTDYGGHGIGTEMHQEPHVLNYGRPGRGPRLKRGMALAIEPMLTLGDPDTRELEDGWTVSTSDGSLAAHVEHSVAITERGPWVLTALDGGADRLAALGVGAAGD